MTKPSLPRIRADGNDRWSIGNGRLGFGLWLEHSKRDLAELGGRLKNGLLAVVYELDDWEVTAELRFHPEVDAWVAHPIEDGDAHLLDEQKGAAAP